MALNVPDVGEKIAVEAFVNKTAPQDLVSRLFTNNITPADTDVAGTYTEATGVNFPGYAGQTLTGATWGAYTAGACTYGAQITWTASGAATADVYGYFVTQLSSGILGWSERDAGAPIAVRNSGDQVKFTPTIGAN